VIWIDDVPRTQARREREIEMMARDWLSLMHDRDADSFELDIEITMPEAARTHLERARVLREESERARVEAAQETAAAALVLHESGLTVREIGPLLHVSHQRAQQLVAAAR
jgi:thioesterase domain-containing protein